MPSLAVASSPRYITQAGRLVTGSIWPGSPYSPDIRAAVTGRAARLFAAAAAPACEPPAWLLPSAPAAAATARLASAISLVPTALKRSRSSAAIGPAPSPDTGNPLGRKKKSNNTAENKYFFTIAGGGGGAPPGAGGPAPPGGPPPPLYPCRGGPP